MRFILRAAAFLAFGNGIYLANQLDSPFSFVAAFVAGVAIWLIDETSPKRRTDQ